MAYTADYIKEKLQKELDAAHVEVVDDSDGCGAKFRVLVVSAKFTGAPLLKRHRMVNDALKEEMANIHAFSQKTFTPEQWAASAEASAPGKALTQKLEECDKKIKVILFGEHSVVHGRSAVAASLGRRTTVTIVPNDDDLLTFDLPAVGLQNVSVKLPGSAGSELKLEGSLLDLPVLILGATKEQLKRLALWAALINDMKIASTAAQAVAVFGYIHAFVSPESSFSQGLDIQVDSELQPGAGTGSSAAYALAVAAALCRWAGIPFDAAQVENLAWKAEHIVHGSPSGLDTAVSARGGIVRVSRGPNGLNFSAATRPEWPLRVLLVDSQVSRNTREMIKRAEERLSWIQTAAEPLLDTMDKVALKALDALQEEQRLGFSRLEHLVDTNHALLCALNVSHPALDDIRAIAARFHLSAKLTGAGGGGNAFVLLPPDLSIDKLKDLQTELEARGYVTKQDVLFGPGVKLL